MTDILSVLISVQAVCEGYQQTTRDAAIKERINTYSFSIFLVKIVTYVDGTVGTILFIQVV